MDSLLNSYSWGDMTTLTETNLIPTLITGTYPHVNGYSQVKLKTGIDTSKRLFVDRLPDWLTSTAQCFIHLFTGSFDLAAVPARRRRFFDITRTKYIPEQTAIDRIAVNAPTIFNIIGYEKSRWIFSRKFHKLKGLIPGLCSARNQLELFEIYALDVIAHWNLDHDGIMRKYYRQVDVLVKQIHEKCRRNNYTLLLFSDHGQEPVKETIDIKNKLKRLNVKPTEYLFFIDAIKARFWFFTEKARKEITALLASIPHGKMLTHKDFHAYHIKFSDTRFGDTFFLADPGFIFFPHDFHHPLANIFMGFDRQQYRRLISPHQKGYHGYLPSHGCDHGFVLVADNRYKIQKNMEIIDFAPSILELLGLQKTRLMRGKCIITEDK